MHRQIWHLDKGPWDGHIHIIEADTDEPADIVFLDNPENQSRSFYKFETRDSWERPEFTYTWMPVPPVIITPIS